MNRFFTTIVLIFGLMLSGILTTSCEEDPLNPTPPEDLPPAIALISPENNNFLIEKTETFSVTLQLADNEALSSFEVDGEIFDTDNALVSSFSEAPQSISGTSQTIIFSGTPPTAAEDYYRIKYTCRAIDAKGVSASTFFWVSVVPPEDPPAEFVVLEFENDSVLTNLVPNRFAFNFTARKMLPTINDNNELDFDIKEVSESGRGIFAPQFESPNNMLLGQDSVFVVTNADRFNYEEATHETLSQAFFSDPAPFSKTPPLKVGDYVIVRLTKAPQPQFAIMRINRLVDDGGGILIQDRVIFDYKVTSQQ
ncbi:MAG: hypothetical protein R8P61_29300 [Bacteroidia bacterium]|nr:hypothetical protein [Bacteroidia bacterium]